MWMSVRIPVIYRCLNILQRMWTQHCNWWGDWRSDGQFHEIRFWPHCEGISRNPDLSLRNELLNVLEESGGTWSTDFIFQILICRGWVGESISHMMTCLWQIHIHVTCIWMLIHISKGSFFPSILSNCLYETANYNQTGIHIWSEPLFSHFICF